LDQNVVVPSAALPAGPTVHRDRRSRPAWRPESAAPPSDGVLTERHNPGPGRSVSCSGTGRFEPWTGTKAYLSGCPLWGRALARPGSGGSTRTGHGRIVGMVRRGAVQGRFPVVQHDRSFALKRVRLVRSAKPAKGRACAVRATHPTAWTGGPGQKNSGGDLRGCCTRAAPRGRA
jgi:hypothetical protein